MKFLLASQAIPEADRPAQGGAGFGRRQWLAGCVALVGASAGLARELTQPQVRKKNAVRVLCYHDVRDRLRQSFQTSPEATAVATSDLVEHFEWLKSNGYSVVSLQQFITARSGGPELPDKAVMLTFDDGYKSVYSHVFPLLKAYRYPAVVACVQQFMTPDANGKVVYDGKPTPQDAFMSWDEVREITRYGLVEFASHSAYSHIGVLANAQGSKLPALVTRIYDPVTAQYETEEAYQQRLFADLNGFANVMEKETGVRPRAVVWPYGAYNETAIEMARKAGHSVAFNLISNLDNATTDLMHLGRDLVMFNAGLGGLATMVKQRSQGQYEETLRTRIVHVDLDYIYDADPLQQEKNLGQLIDRVRSLGASHVYLQAFADPDGNGSAKALYFPNRHLPMRADLFRRAAWQLKTRGGVYVYAWLPVMAFELPLTHPAARQLVQTHRSAPAGHAATRYIRLSPYSDEARQVMREIYHDFGKHAWGTRGVLFHDDATLNDFEDTSPSAMQAYAKAGLPGDFDELRKSDANARAWSRLKTKALTDLTLELAGVLRQYIPDLETSRNIYAPVVLDPAAQVWFAQDLDNMLASYDYTAVMAMPYMEKATAPEQWLKTLAETVLKRPDAAGRVVFELQSKDWLTNKPIATAVLAEHVMILRRAGVRHIGYYPDNFVDNHPDIKLLKPAFSTTTFPVKP
jgi:poly-beta-1,6-N-acetyl-D-glucosamine N-deacetylase